MAERRPRPRVAGHPRWPATGRTPPAAAADPVAERSRPAAPDPADLQDVREAADPDPAQLPPPEPAEPAADPAPAADLLVVGRVGKPQGIRGEVTVQVRTDDPEARFSTGAALLTDPAGRGPLVVASTRDQNGRLVVRFEGSEDRNAAEALRGTLLLVDAATLPPPDDADAFHDFQLVGLTVELPDGTPVGSVAEMLHLPHGDVLAVRRGPGAAELLVPFLAAMVPVVDVAAGRIVVDPPPGLLELTADPPDEPDEPDDPDDPVGRHEPPTAPAAPH